MAKIKKENLIKVKALVNLKYDINCFKINDEFDIKSEDIKEMQSRGYVKLLEELKVKDIEEKDEEELKESE